MGEAEQDLQDAAQTRALPARDGRIQVVVVDEVKQLQKTADGRTYEDGVLNLSDGREMSWRWWSDPDGTPILRIQGTPGFRKQYNPNPNVQREVGARYLMADRAGYGGSMRKPGRGIADIAEDYAELLDAHGLDRVPATGTSGGGPHVLAVAALHPDRGGAVGDVKTSVTWWHGDDDMNAPLSAARRVVAQLPKVDLRTWHNEGHFVSLTHEKEILEELLSRS